MPFFIISCRNLYDYFIFANYTAQLNLPMEHKQ